MNILKGVKKTKKIILLIGISGSGKTTIAKHLKDIGILELISHTTRQIRVGEIPNETYYYISKEEFDKIDKLEQTFYAGNYYCLSRAEVERHEEDLVYCIVDAEGVEQIRKNYGEENVFVICIHIPLSTMKERLRQRGDSENEIKKRIDNAINTHEQETNLAIADFKIQNDNLNKSIMILDYIVNGIREVADEEDIIL